MFIIWLARPIIENAVDKAMLYAFRDRRNKKRSFRAQNTFLAQKVQGTWSGNELTQSLTNDGQNSFNTTI